jgi:hypothetical protein
MALVQRPSLLKMLTADRNITDITLIYPFPDLIFQQQRKTEHTNPSQTTAQPKTMERRPVLNINKLKQKLPLAGIINKGMWSQEDLQKWVEARKKRFPSAQNLQTTRELKEEEISTVEKKLRLKLLLLDDDYDKQKKIHKSKNFLFKTATVSRGVRRRFENKTDDSKPVVTEDNDAPIEIKNPKSEIEVQEIAKTQNEEVEVRARNFSAQDIIAHFKEKKKADNADLTQFLSKQPKTFNYNYLQNTLFANLVLDQVYEERTYLLDMIKFIVDNNFLQTNSNEVKPN